MMRKIDNIRRFTIPKKFMKELELDSFQACEITIEYGYICIKPFDSQNIEMRPNVGIVRRLDKLNRLVIPYEYIDVLMLQTSKFHEVILEGKTIKISK